MTITNSSKPTTSLTNTTKVSFEETWDSNITTWDTETRSWDDMGSIINNTTKNFTASLWSIYTFPWQLSLPWQYATEGLTNISKPI